jgi:hypothetical protein
LIAFLDFDGVLHPDGQPYRPGPDPRMFSNLPRLEALLREFPGVRIVISSAWRHDTAFDDLLSYFSEDMRPRILGVTPLAERVDGYMPAEREKEILAWLADNGGHEQPWVAIDDADFQFKEHLARLVVCDADIGFDEAASAELRVHFKRWSS